MSADPRDDGPDGGRHDGPVRSPIAAGLVLGAAADLLLADPRRGHPVAGFGSLAARLERRSWRDDRTAGAAYAGGLVAAAAGLRVALDRATRGPPRRPGRGPPRR